MSRRGEHAVVIGASVGGLCAARVLSDCYRRVTVFDRDTLPADAVNRKAIPQGNHLHLLLARGAAELDAIFPGLLQDMTDAGVAVLRDYRREIHLDAVGHVVGSPDQLRQNFSTFVPSRPHLEWQLRRRVAALPNVTMTHQAVQAPCFDAERQRVSGVLVDPAQHEPVAADLVVDATGRGSRLPMWLQQWGFAHPRESTSEVGISYTTHRLRMPPDAFTEKIVLAGVTRTRPTGIGMLGYEDGTWILTTFGVAGAEAPTDLAGTLELARQILPQRIYRVLERAEPVGEPLRSRFPTSRWRRYDKLRRFPSGIVALGDSVCSSNPTYGQGMTMSALQAAELRRCLAGGDDRLGQRFFRAVAKLISPSWRTNAMTDRLLHQANGPVPLRTRLFGAVSEPLLRAAENDPVLAEDFLRIFSMLEPPRLVPTPDTLWRIIIDVRRRHAHLSDSPGDGYPVSARSRSGSI